MRRFIALAILLVGCSATGVNGSVDSATGLTVRTQTDRASVAAGQQLRITVTVTNSSSETRTLQFATSCQTGYEFLDTRGQVVAVSQPVCLQALTQRTLAPGGSFVDSHTWTRDPLELPQLSPGSYQLRGVLLAREDTVRSAAVGLSIP